MSKTQQILGAEGYENYRRYILQKESSGDYAVVNRLGFMGGYQMGVPALKDAGLIRRDAPNSNSAALNDSNWTIPGGRQAFLNNPALQDKAFATYTDKNLGYLNASRVIGPNTSAEQTAGYLGASHLVGAGAVNADRSLSKKDANGVQAKSYYDGAAGAVSGKTPVPPAGAAKPGAKPKTEQRPREVYSGKNVNLGDSGVGTNIPVSYTPPGNVDIVLPQPNPLRSFASFTTIITLSCLTADEYNYPEQSYKAGRLGKIIAKSGGSGDQVVSLAAETSDNRSGKYEFFITDFEFELEATFNRLTLGSNLTDMKMTIIEPYSMGMLFQALEVAARENGHETGYNLAPFLITIEFVGWDDNGNSHKVPNTTRHLPVHLVDMSMEVTGAGSTYSLQAIAYNETAVSDLNNVFKTDIGIAGSTVQEILQSGEFSLQAVINKRIQEMNSKEKVKGLPDEILIVFPKDSTNIANSESNSDNEDENNNQDNDQLIDLNDRTATQDPNESKSVDFTTRINATRGANNLVVQDNSTLNDIGISSMDFSQSMAGESKQVQTNVAQPDASKGIRRKNATYDPKSRLFVFEQGSTIINAITNVIVVSEYGKSAVEKANKDPSGLIPWFRIETAVYIKPSEEGNLGKNRPPVAIVFKVVPYFVHSAKYKRANSEPKGLDWLTEETAKVYDYIYTGKNEEIIDFKLNFTTLFGTPQLADNGLLNAATFYSTKNSAGLPDTSPIISSNESGEIEGNNGKTDGQNTEVNALVGGTPAADHRTLIAQMFNYAILNDMSTDVVQVELQIQGDPYFIADSGIGNFSNTGSGRFNITEDVAMDYQSGIVTVILNFRTPIDYGPTGIMEFGVNTEVLEEFSGLYELVLTKSAVSKGKFTQLLTLNRIDNQKPRPQVLAGASTTDAVAERANGSEELRDETGQLSTIRRNTETGDLYDSTGLYDDNGRATFDPNNPAARTKVRTSPAVANAEMLVESSTPENTFSSDYIAP